MFANKQNDPLDDSIENTCRTCMKNSNLLSINEPVTKFLRNIIGVNFEKNDEMPQNICQKCATKINEIMEFIEQCKQTDLNLKSLFESRVIKQEFVEIKTEIIDEFIETREIKEEIMEENAVTSQQPTVKRKIPRRGRRKNRSNTCEICHKTYTLHCNLKRHQLLHFGVRPHKCQKCGKRFIQSSDLRIHERTHEHRKEKTCHVCGKTFKYACLLKEHLMKHNKVKPHVCDICGKGVTTNSILLHHKKLHERHVAMETEGAIKCQKCGHVFKNRKSLKTHLYRNTCLALKLEVA